MPNQITTTVTKSIVQAGQPALNSQLVIQGIQAPPLEATITCGAPLTINDGIGVLHYAALQLLYILSDQLDITIKFYSATAAGGSLINTLTIYAGAAFEWDTEAGTNPLGTTDALSCVIAALTTAGGVASILTATNVHIRTSLLA
jgi:hypothetical protein